MGEEFKDFEVEAPLLTLEPDLTEEKEEIAALWSIYLLR